MNITPASTDVGRTLPLAAGAFYLNFISQYGTAIVTTLAIVYGIMQIFMRWREHRKIMAAKTAQEAEDHGSI